MNRLNNTDLSDTEISPALFLRRQRLSRSDPVKWTCTEPLSARISATTPCFGITILTRDCWRAVWNSWPRLAAAHGKSAVPGPCSAMLLPWLNFITFMRKSLPDGRLFRQVDSISPKVEVCIGAKSDRRSTYACSLSHSVAHCANDAAPKDSTFSLYCTLA